MADSKSTVLKKKTVITFTKKDIEEMQKAFEKFLKNEEQFEVSLLDKNENEVIITTAEAE